MKVVLLLNKFPFGVHDGGAWVSRSMAYALRNIEEDVMFMAPDTQKHPFVKNNIPADINPENWVPLPCLTQVTWLGLLWTSLFTRSYHLWRYQRSITLETMEKTLKSTGPQILILEGMTGLALIPWCRKIAPQSVIIYYAHNVEWQVWNSLARLAPSVSLRRFVLNIISGNLKREELKNLRCADLVLSVSENDVVWFSDHLKNTKCDTLFPGLWNDVAHPIPLPEISGEKIRFYHVGAMNWLPTATSIQRFLHELWPDLKKQFPEIELHLGGSHMPEKIRNHLPQGVFVHGFIQDMARFISDKHFCLVPAIAGSGIKIKILEAMALGRPVITTRTGAEGLPVSQDLNLIQADDFSDLPHKIKYALSLKSEIIKEIVQSGQRYILEHFSQKSATFKLQNQMKSLINEK